ncbi:hypothetical protein O59_001628 [Cellvibrio sp. BR]|nr:hypothetical protein O59_001628 [Cellvibrio sp. BR]
MLGVIWVNLKKLRHDGHSLRLRPIADSIKQKGGKTRRAYPLILL